tara:strand:- start:66 stop:1385 length:1320 start_codon:yes stop_codon:yes gene_type:complete
MPFKTILKNIGGTIKTVSEFVEDEVLDPISNEFEYRAKELEQFRADTFGTAEPDSWEMQTSNLVQKAVDASPVGVAEQGAIILGGNTAETVGLPRGVGEFVGGALAPGIAAPAPSAITRATRAATKNSVKTAVKETAEGLKTIGDDLMPPPPAALATAGAAPRVQLNVSRGKANLTPEVMPIITTKNPDVLSATNRKTGEEIIGSDLNQLKWQRKRTQNIQSQDNRITTFEQEKLELQNNGANPQGDSVNDIRLRRVSSYLDDAKAARNRYISNVVPFTDADPNWYKTGRGVWEKKIEQNLKYKHVKAALEQHHLVAKGATGAIFGKMDEFIAKGLADPDDLVLMYEYMRAKGVTPGDVKSNMVNILKPAHTGKNRGLHRYLNESGAEFKQAKWDDILKAAEDPEDLMAILVDQVENNFVPNKEVGKIWQDLDDVLESL